MPDSDFVIADEDILDEKPQDALAFRYIEGIGRRAKSSKERGQRFGQTQVGCTIDQLIDDRLQFGIVRLLAPPQLRHALAQLIQRQKAFLVGSEQTIDALADTNELTPESLFASFGRVGLACGCEASIDLTLDEFRIFEQAYDFRPDDLVEKVLAHRSVVANELAKVSVGVGTEATVIIDLARA